MGTLPNTEAATGRNKAGAASVCLELISLYLADMARSGASALAMPERCWEAAVPA